MQKFGEEVCHSTGNNLLDFVERLQNYESCTIFRCFSLLQTRPRLYSTAVRNLSGSFYSARRV